MFIYSLDDIYSIYKNNMSYELDTTIIDRLNNINSNIIPINVEKLESPEKR